LHRSNLGTHIMYFTINGFCIFALWILRHGGCHFNTDSISMLGSVEQLQCEGYNWEIQLRRHIWAPLLELNVQASIGERWGGSGRRQGAVAAEWGWERSICWAVLGEAINGIQSEHPPLHTGATWRVPRVGVVRPHLPWRCSSACWATCFRSPAATSLGGCGWATRGSKRPWWTGGRGGAPWGRRVPGRGQEQGALRHHGRGASWRWEAQREQEGRALEREDTPLVVVLRWRLTPRRAAAMGLMDRTMLRRLSIGRVLLCQPLAAGTWLCCLL